MTRISERVLQDTTNGLPEAVALVLEWVLYGTMPEPKIDELFNHVESLLVDTTGPSMAGAVSMAFQGALRVLGVKSKILNMGNGDSVHELARIACQASDDDASRAIQRVIAEQEPKAEPLQSILQGVLRSSVKLLPGVSETSFVVGMLSNVATGLGFSDVKEKVELLAIVIIRYPDRVYRFLRRAFTLAVLHGHDVSQRAVQAEVLAAVVPDLVDYFQSLTATPPLVESEDGNSAAEQIPSLVFPCEENNANDDSVSVSSEKTDNSRKDSAENISSARAEPSDTAVEPPVHSPSDTNAAQAQSTQGHVRNHGTTAAQTRAAKTVPSGENTETSKDASKDPPQSSTASDNEVPSTSDDVAPSSGMFSGWRGMLSRSGSATAPAAAAVPAGTEPGATSFLSSMASRAQHYVVQAATAPQSAIQVAGMAATALGGGYFSALAQTASLGYNVYDGHRQSEREVQAWHHARVRMLRDASEKLRIEKDFFVDQWQELMALGCTALVLPAVAGVWNDIERIGSLVYRTFDADGALLQTLGLENEDVTAMLVAMACVLYSSLFLMLYKNAAFLRFTTPSLILSVLFMLRTGNTWFLAYSASTNAVKILLLLLKAQAWSMADMGPPLVFMVSALSTLLEQSALVLTGRFLPFLIIVAYVAGLSDVSFHIVAIAIGKLGQILLSFMLREKRGVMRRIVMWCFDDLLQAMAPMADTTICPDDKLHLISPTSFVSSLVSSLTETRAILLGVGVGIFKGTTLPWWCWAMVALIEVGVVVGHAAVHKTQFEDCWDRWNALLPEHAPRIAHMERFWRAYLQTKPTFTLTASTEGAVDGAAADGYHLCLRLYEPWVRGATRYAVRYRAAVGFLDKIPDWTEYKSPDVTSRAAFDRHVADPDARIYLSGLDMATMYEVRVDAIRNAGSGLIVGNVLRARTDFPTLTVSNVSATTIKIKATDPSVLQDKVVKLRYRRGVWPWNYRISLNILTAPKLMLSDDGTCSLQGLTSGCSYEVQFQIVEGDTAATDWLPVTPPTVTLPEPRRLGRVTHNFTAKHDNEVSALAGEVLVLLSDVDEHWIHVKLGEQTGIFPKNRYIEETVEASTPDGAMPERSNAREGMLHNLAARAMSGNMDITTPARQPRVREPALD
eukprot:m.1400379 g.1400379  ORF g.1400379 m.1400379 type:complete len:1133 (-) comp25003_c0_seq43:1525-4923(-)